MGAIALIGDLHFGVKNFNLDFLEEQLRGLEEYAKMLKAKQVKTIIQLGDVFDNRKNMDNNFLHVLKERLIPIFKDFDVYCLIGNHDMYFKETRNVNSPSLFLKDFFKDIFDKPCNKIIEDFKLALFPYFTEREFLQMQEIDLIEDITKDSEVILGHFEFRDFNFAYNSMNNHSNYSLKDFKKDCLLFSGHYHFSNSKHYIGTPYQIDFKEFGLIPKILILRKENNNIFEEEIENTWNKRHYKVEIYKDRVLFEYDFQKSKEIFSPKQGIPSFCKIGNIYVKEDNVYLEKILEYFSVKSDNISVYRENVVSEIEFMILKKKENIMSSDLYIKEYIKENKPELLELLERIWK